MLGDGDPADERASDQRDKACPPPLHLTLQHGEPHIRVEVTDSTLELPENARPDLDHKGGRGLWLIAVLADRRGHHSHGLWKAVWFELTHPPARHSPTL